MNDGMSEKEMLQELNAKVDKTAKKVSSIEQALKGYNGEHGQPGLCGQFDKLAKDYHQFKRRCLVVFGVLIGSGVLGIVVERFIV